MQRGGNARRSREGWAGALRALDAGHRLLEAAALHGGRPPDLARPSSRAAQSYQSPVSPRP
eukprot:828467-Pyramimonas_sp.AAC.1